MEKSGLRLDALPSEIIQRIASVGPCENVLALVRVNHALRRVCNDNHVFRSIIRNRSGWGGSEWQDIPLTGLDSTSAWARYALADSKAVTADKMSSPKLFAKWGPQLMISHHPVLHQLRNANMLFYSATQDAWGIDHMAVLFFCLALRLMSQSPPDDVAQPGLLPAGRTSNSAFPPPRQVLRQHLMTHLSWPLLTYGDEEHWWCPERETTAFLNIYCKALEALGFLSIRIREELAKGTIREVNRLGFDSSPAAPVQISVPTTESIRFHTFMDIPLPFAKDILTVLPFCHLTSMTSKAFLEDGEWAGFYSMSFGHMRTRTFDPPMRGVQFQVCDDPELPARNLQARGQDEVGSFQLYGKIALKTGEMTLEKQYDDYGPHWSWVCVMTPFGIAGTWGRDDWGGWVWLWKV